MERDGYWNMEQPSIDREDNDGNYCYDNCQFIEMSKNRIKDRKKPIIQYDLNGNFIREWESQSMASKALNISQGNIGMCCLGKYKTSGGYIWRYKNV